MRELYVDYPEHSRFALLMLGNTPGALMKDGSMWRVEDEHGELIARTSTKRDALAEFARFAGAEYDYEIREDKEYAR